MANEAKLLLSYGDVKALGINYSKWQLRRRMRDGTFPQAIKLGGSRLAWRRDEILEWIEQLPRSKK
jgi:predicted DNA-binding transcriptional regulator AlpA